MIGGCFPWWFPPIASIVIEIHPLLSAETDRSTTALVSETQSPTSLLDWWSTSSEIMTHFPQHSPSIVDTNWPRQETVHWQSCENQLRRNRWRFGQNRWFWSIDQWRNHWHRLDERWLQSMWSHCKGSTLASMDTMHRRVRRGTVVDLVNGWWRRRSENRRRRKWPEWSRWEREQWDRRVWRWCLSDVVVRFRFPRCHADFEKDSSPADDI